MSFTLLWGNFYIPSIPAFYFPAFFLAGMVTLLEGVLSKDQFDSLCKFLGNQVAAVVKSGHESASPVLPLIPDAPGHSKAASSQVGITGKSLARASARDILGTSMGDGSEVDDLGDVSVDDQEG